MANHDVVIWAVPRFRRPVRQITPGQITPGNGRGLPRVDASGLEEGLLKTLGEAIAENPDGAACLYGCHV